MPLPPGKDGLVSGQGFFPGPMRYAFFDLDHTLLPFDTQALFCNFVLRRHPWRIVLHLWFLPFALGRALGLVSTATTKRAFLSYLAGMKRAHLRRLAREGGARSMVEDGMAKAWAGLTTVEDVLRATQQR